jgi:hypothetical protein
MTIRWGRAISTKVAFTIILGVGSVTVFIIAHRALSIVGEIEQRLGESQLREEQTLERLKERPSI